MSSVRLSQRIPTRPSAQFSPSPDKGTKSIIISTTPPKINKQHLINKKDKDIAIHKIKEENKKLKEEMKILLDKNKEMVKGDQMVRSKGTIKKNDRREDREKQKQKEIEKQKQKQKEKEKQKEKDQILANERTTEKQVSKHEKKQTPPRQSNFDVTFGSKPTPTSSYINPSLTTSYINTNTNTHTTSTLPIDIKHIKSQLLILIQQKQFQTKHHLESLQQRISKLQQYQYKLIQRINQLHKKSLIKSTTSRNHQNSHQYYSQEPSQQISPSSNLNTPKKSQPRHKQFIRQLESQLKGAQLTIHKLEQILRNEEKSSEEMKLETQKRQEQFKAIKLQNQSFANDLKLAYKEANQNRQLKIYFEKEIEILKQRIKEHEISRSQQTSKISSQSLNKEKDLQNRYEDEIRSLKKQIERYRQEQQIRSQQLLKSKEKQQTDSIRREQERKRNTKTQLEEFETKMEETNNILKILQDQIDIQKKEKNRLEQEIEELKQKIDQYVKQIHVLSLENNDFKKTIKKSAGDDGLQRKIAEQEENIMELKAQRADIQAKMENLINDHKMEVQAYIKELKEIKELTKIITDKINLNNISEINDSEVEVHRSQTVESSSSALKYKQQILSLQSNIHNLQSEKDKTQSHNTYLQQQNSILKQEIKQLKESIEEYSKGTTSTRDLMKGRGDQIEGYVMEEMEGIGGKFRTSSKLLGEAVGRMNEIFRSVEKEIGEEWRTRSL